MIAIAELAEITETDEDTIRKHLGFTTNIKAVITRDADQYLADFAKECFDQSGVALIYGYTRTHAAIGTLDELPAMVAKLTQLSQGEEEVTLKVKSYTAK